MVANQHFKKQDKNAPRDSIKINSEKNLISMPRIDRTSKMKLVTQKSKWVIGDLKVVKELRDRVVERVKSQSRLSQQLWQSKKKLLEPLKISFMAVAKK